MKTLFFILQRSCLLIRFFANKQTLFSGTDFNAFELSPGSWEIEPDGSMVCRMEKSKDKNGNERIRGMGYIWTKEEFSDFELTLEYKLSEGANSGIFIEPIKTTPFREALKSNSWIMRRVSEKNKKSTSSPQIKRILL